MFAIVAAIGLVGAVAIQSIVAPQQAFADKPTGCDKKSQGFESSGGNCRQTGHNG